MSDTKFDEIVKRMLSKQSDTDSSVDELFNEVADQLGAVDDVAKSSEIFQQFTNAVVDNIINDEGFDKIAKDTYKSLENFCKERNLNGMERPLRFYLITKILMDAHIEGLDEMSIAILLTGCEAQFTRFLKENRESLLTTPTQGSA